MASYSQNKYCSNCKKNVTTTKKDPNHCPICNEVVNLREWTVRFRVVENGKRINKRLSGFPTKKEAQKGMADFLISYDPKTKVKQESYIFEELLKEHLELNKTQTAPATYYDKKALFQKYITPHFIGKDLSKLTKEDCLKWQDYLWRCTKDNKTPLSHKYKSKIRGHFSTFLSFCEQRYNIVNYFSRIKMPRNIAPKKEMAIIELSEFNNFIKAIETDYSIEEFKRQLYKTLFMCLFYLGPRINELLALTPKDIDLTNKKITFNKSISRKLDKETYNQPYIVKPTKNYTNRINIIPDILLKELKTYLEQKNIADKFLFGENDPINDKVVTRAKNKYIKQTNIKYIRIHDFRHSHVSFLIHLGATFPVIAKRIGDTLDIVIKTYSHLYSNDEDIAINALNNYINAL